MVGLVVLAGRPGGVCDRARAGLRSIEVPCKHKVEHGVEPLRRRVSTAGGQTLGRAELDPRAPGRLRRTLCDEAAWRSRRLGVAAGARHRGGAPVWPPYPKDRCFRWQPGVIERRCKHALLTARFFLR